jgi:hypothetical protein
MAADLLVILVNGGWRRWPDSDRFVARDGSARLI